MARTSFRSFLKDGTPVETQLSDNGYDRINERSIPRFYTMAPWPGGSRGFPDGTVVFEARWLTSVAQQIYCTWTYNIMPEATLEWWLDGEAPSPANRVTVQDTVADTIDGSPVNGYRINNIIRRGQSDTRLQFGQTYQLRLSGRDGLILRAQVTMPDASTALPVPSRPSGVQGFAGELIQTEEGQFQDVRLNWRANPSSEMVTKYQTRRDNGRGEFNAAIETASTSTLYQRLAVGLRYQFEVRAWNGQWGAWTRTSVNVVGIVDQEEIPPTAPFLGSTYGRTATSVKVQFRRPLDGDVDRYEYNTGGGWLPWTVSIPDDDVFREGTVGGLAGDISYTLRIRAINEFGTSPASNSVTIPIFDDTVPPTPPPTTPTVPPPTTPTVPTETPTAPPTEIGTVRNTDAQSQTRAVFFSWDAPDNRFQYQYDVEYDNATRRVNRRFFHATELDDEESVSIRVRAVVDISGLITLSDWVTISGTSSAGRIVVAPGSPHTIESVKETSNSIEWIWFPPFDDGGEAVTYEYRLQGTSTWIPTSGTGATTGDLDPSTRYILEVVALNSAGRSPADTGTGRTLGEVTQIGPPTGLQLTAEEGVNANTADLSWTIESDGGSPLVGFILEYEVDGSNRRITYSSATFSASISVTATTNFSLRAWNQRGYFSTAASAEYAPGTGTVVDEEFNPCATGDQYVQDPATGGFVCYNPTRRRNVEYWVTYEAVLYSGSDTLVITADDRLSIILYLASHLRGIASSCLDAINNIGMGGGRADESALTRVTSILSRSELDAYMELIPSLNVSVDGVSVNIYDVFNATYIAGGTEALVRSQSVSSPAIGAYPRLSPFGFIAGFDEFSLRGASSAMVTLFNEFPSAFGIGRAFGNIISVAEELEKAKATDFPLQQEFNYLDFQITQISAGSKRVRRVSLPELGDVLRTEAIIYGIDTPALSKTKELTLAFVYNGQHTTI